EAFFFLWFNGFCHLSCGIVAPQVLTVFFTGRRRSRIGMYLLDYLVGAVPPVATLENKLRQHSRRCRNGFATKHVVTLLHSF
ncbi:hypothetical protein BS420_22310, partial [Cronobacter sakazakii]